MIEANVRAFWQTSGLSDCRKMDTNDRDQFVCDIESKGIDSARTLRKQGIEAHWYSKRNRHHVQCWHRGLQWGGGIDVQQSVGRYP